MKFRRERSLLILLRNSDDFIFNQGNPTILKIPVQTIAVILKILKFCKF